jgi:ubiquinone/menaquinone biosynthesis C-methylase UbiE
MIAVNLGGEGEIPGFLNQQSPWALSPNWFATTSRTLAELQAAGHQFVYCPNDHLVFADDSIDFVYTNSVPLDLSTHLGPGVQSSEIERILKSGGILGSRWHVLLQKFQP